MSDPTELISRHFDDSLLPHELAELSHWLRADPENARLFARRALMEHHLCDHPVDEPATDLNDAVMMPALADRSSDASAHASSHDILLSLAGKKPITRESAPVLLVAPARRFTWRKAAVILLPLLLATAGWLLLRSNSSSTTLTTSVGVAWGAGVEVRDGERLPTKTIALKAGLAELRLASGASVIVEGPAKFRARSDNAIDLDAGRLTAMVPTAAHGFTVRTPSASVVDLGTEFGINVDPSGKTTVDVFEGHVEIAQRNGGAGAATSGAPGNLSAGDVAVVAETGITVSVNSATPQAFVRSLSTPTSIDLADLICGGDGTTHRRSGAVDPRTGKSGALAPFGNSEFNDANYHPVPKLPAIDGCFVPDGTVKINSDGQTFDFGTTGGSSFNQIYAGGMIPWPFAEDFKAILGGVDYGRSPRGVVLMHPNCGISFDLAMLRRLHPGLKIGNLHAVFGNTYTGNALARRSNLFAVVDGISRFEKHNFLAKDGALSMDVPLSESDRFLTLVATDDGTSAQLDWVILGDPRLE